MIYRLAHPLVITVVRYTDKIMRDIVKNYIALSVLIVVANKLKHYLIIGGKLRDDNHTKSLITIMQGNNINEIVMTITGLFHLICSQFTNDNYILEGSDKVMRIINKICETNVSYIEIKEVTI